MAHSLVCVVPPQISQNDEKCPDEENPYQEQSTVKSPKKSGPALVKRPRTTTMQHMKRSESKRFMCCVVVGRHFLGKTA